MCRSHTWRSLVPLLLVLCVAPAAAQNAVVRGAELVEREEFAAARRSLEPYARSHLQDHRAAHYLGRAYYGERSLDSAVVWLERAAQLNPRDSEYHLHLGNAYGMQAAESSLIRRAVLARKAKASFDLAVERAPNSADARMGLVRFYVMAPAILGGDMKKARQEAGAIRRINPYRAFEAFAMIHREEGNPAAAIAEYQTGVRQYPDSAYLYFALANGYNAGENWDASMDVMESLLRRRPTEMGAYYQIGRIGAMAGRRLERAEAALQRYLRHTPSREEPALVNAHWRLGMIYERRGETARARAAYRTALAQDPDHVQAQGALAKLGN